jgi:hypothetical protein
MSANPSPGVDSLPSISEVLRGLEFCGQSFVVEDLWS